MERRMWEEVPNGLEDDDEAETMSLLARQEGEFNALYAEQMLHGGGSSYRPSRQSLTKLETRLYYVVCLVVLLANLTAGAIALWKREQGLSQSEHCSQPLDKYLVFSAVHSFGTVVFLIAYMVCLRQNVIKGLPNYRFLDNSDDQPAIFLLETFLLALTLIQVGLGILAEIWAGELGGFYTGQAKGCSVTSPNMYETTAILGLYQLWIVIAILFLLIRAACTSKTTKSGYVDISSQHEFIS
eukprot:TRINITY_DN995_c0_g1_i2.p1 TRINITY_DN995_c0_g1~~TRINITY_DN995_c0_g1_i2.p1  ORF type:complete len:241 (+),score=2.65 TRINITY_DN995_c0_g1_i2:151-873(+)